MSSAFDDLLDLGDTSGNSNQSANPFDPIGTNQTGGSSEGDLLGLGFDTEISTQNGNSGKVSFEANTNPLYELSQNTMESEASNPLFDFNAETQKEAKIESGGNPLYDFLQSENTNGTNGHTEDVLTNGGTQHEVDLLGMSADVPAGTVTSDDSGVTLDSNNLNESNADLEPEQELEPEPAQELESEPALQIESEPAQEVESEPAQEMEQEPEQQVEQEPEQDTKAEAKEDYDEEVAQERSRTNSEASEPEEQKQVDEPLEQNGTHLSEGTAESSDQPEEPLEAGDSVKQEVENGEVEDVKAESTVVEEDQTGPVPIEEGKPRSVEAQGADIDDKPAANDGADGENVVNEAVEVEAEKVEEPSIQEDEIVKAEPEPEVQAAIAPEPQETENTAADSIEEEPKDSEKIIPESELGPEPEGPVSNEPKPDMAEPVLEELPEQQSIEPAVEENVETAVSTEEQEKTEQPISEPDEAEQVVAPEPVQSEQESAKEEERQDPVPEPEQVEQELAVQDEKQELAPEPKQVEQESAIEDAIQDPVPEPEPEQVKEEIATQDEKQSPVPEPEQVEEAKPEEEAENTPPLEVAVETPDVGNEEQKEPESQARETTEAAESEPAENGVAKVNGTSDVKENGLTEEEAVRDPSIFRETREKEEVHFAEMNNFRQKFESGKIDDKEPEPKKKSVKEEYDDGGEFENEPVKNPDVVREADQAEEDLPEAGTAKNLLDKFKSIQEEKAVTITSQKRESPPRQDKVEYESTPTERLVIEAGQSEIGEFESTPAEPEGVVRSGDIIEDAQPEKGYAKNMLNKFKEIQSGSSAPQPRERREITPDRSGKVEYISEPRGQKIEYDENRVDTGVFENQPTEEEEVVRSQDRPDEILPESGMAKNLLSKFKQMESEVGNRPPPSPKREVREITPDRSGKVEYTSEPRGSKIQYEEQKEDQGIFESKPAIPPEVVRCEDTVEDFKPEAGAAKKTLERYKEMQKQSSSPVSSTPRKEITPPRDTTSPGKTIHGVVENTPTAARDDVVRCEDHLQDELPEQGSAKNILNKFKEIQSAGNSPAESPTKKIKEFTPPPEAGVYENTPTEHLIIEPQQSFEGVLESTPEKSKADVARDYEHSPEKELPETGFAKNLVSKFRQLETTSAKTSTSSSPKFKEFTPPRDRGPLSPKSPAGAPSAGVNLSDLPGQYQQQDKPGIFENEPEVKADVYREADTDYNAGLPAPNTTSSILQRFKSIQEQAKEDQKTPAPISRKEKGMFKVVQTEKCEACQKTVYAMEKLELNNHIYHKTCFKCSHCSARLTPKTFSMNEGVVYCTNHFKQLFARKGNYDEGFGRQQYKKKWGADSQKEVATA